MALLTIARASSTAFLRHRGYPSADVQEFAQAFFAHLLEHNRLSRSDQAARDDPKSAERAVSRFSSDDGLPSA
jgi:hypothetical protein